MNGIIGKKTGMTSVFDEYGNNLAVTVVEIQPNIVTQIKTEERDGYNALQLGTGDAKAKNTSYALQGHYDRAGTGPKKIVREFRNFEIDKALGDAVHVEEVFEEGDIIDVVGVSKGRGFQGVVKRHHFSGVGDKTHGQAHEERRSGSIGASSDPSRVFKGMRMPGRMGGDRTKIRNLEVVKIFPDKNLILIKGAIPGHKGAFVRLEK